MASLLSSDVGVLAYPPATDSLISLLQQGIECTKRGSYLEGAAFFAVARERLTPDQIDYAALLDTFLQSHAGYLQAQQVLFMASRRFVEADIEQQTHLLVIKKLLQALSDEADAALQTHTEAQPGETSERQPQPQRQSAPLFSSDPDHYKASDVGASASRQALLKRDAALPSLYITCFGHFEVKRLDRAIALCHRRNGQAILRFLVAQAGYRASVDKLIDVLWAQDVPEIARRKLQIAVSALRSSLNSGYACEPGEGYILYKDGFYQFNPSVTVRTDVEEFLLLWQTGRQSSGSESATLYERACNLCSGPFLVEDLYADWSSTRREQLKQIYFSMCRSLAEYYMEIQHYEDAARWASAILSEDRCDEAAHRQLIQIHIARGCRSEALQQYHRCERVLSEELGVSPAPATMKMLQAILNSADLPLHEKFSGR